MSAPDMPAHLDAEKSVAEDASTGEEQEKKTQDEQEGSLKDYLVRLIPTRKNHPPPRLT